MAKKVTSSRTSKDPEATSGAGAAVAERSKDIRKPGEGKPAVRRKSPPHQSKPKTTGSASKEPVKKAASPRKATEGQSRAGAKSSGGKSSIASKVVEGLKATATGALGAVSLAAQALTSENKRGKRK